MPIDNVVEGEPIETAWGNDVADTVNAVETLGLAHASRHNAAGADALAADQAAGTASLRSLGTGATQAAAGNHSHYLIQHVRQAFSGLGAGGVDVAVTWPVAFADTSYTAIGTFEGNINQTGAISVTTRTKSTTGATFNVRNQTGGNIAGNLAAIAIHD